MIRISIAMLPVFGCSVYYDNSGPAPDQPQVETELRDCETIELDPAPYSEPYISAHVMEEFAHGASVALALGALNRINLVGLPKNARQTAEGYWLGGQPYPQEIDELHAHKIKLIVTAASIKSKEFKEIKSRMNSLNIEHLNIPFGGSFPKSKKFYDTLQSYRPEQIYIHCEHGGDRSGALLAYLLIVDQGWSIPKAFLSVAFPGPNDSRRLIEILRKRGFEVSQEDIDQYLGIYSAENNGGFGGLKVRSSAYVKLINTTIDEALRQSDSLARHP